MRILAMDLGKGNTVSCLLDTDTGEQEFRTTRMRREAVVDLLERSRPDLVVFEVSTDAGWIADLCRERSLRLAALNPASLVRSSHRGRAKSDRRDAEDLARLAAVDHRLRERGVHIPSPAVRERRALIEQRAKAVARRTARRNELRSLFQSFGEELPRGHAAWTSKGLALVRERAEAGALGAWGLRRVESMLRGLGESDEEVAELEGMLDEIAEADPRTARLQSPRGVGPRGAEAVVAWIDDPKRFRSAKQVSCYVGLSPRPNQSGSSDRTSRISGAGPKRLRTVLVEVAWTMLRWNEWAREVYERALRGSPSRKKQAIVAVARRLLVRLWAMLRDGTEWDPGHGRRVAARQAGSPA